MVTVCYHLLNGLTSDLKDLKKVRRDGTFVSFAEYRFAVKARLNLLPTKAVVKRADTPQLDVTCPKCKSQPETLGHILNTCTPNVGLMRERHNAVLQWLVKATPESLGEKFVEQKIKDSPGCLRPDLVIWHKEEKAVSIVDVTIPFEGTEDAFEKVRDEKVSKYQPLIEWLKTKGYDNVFLQAFVLGSLGSWDNDNETVLKKLNIGPKYASVFRKLCAVDSIKGSLTIWKAKG